MSTCIKHLYDYELVKKSLKCGIISLKSNFVKIERRKMVIDQSVKFVVRNFVKCIIMIIKIEYKTL